MTCGIYSITHKLTGRIYVGQSVHIERRWSRHIKSPQSLVGRALQKHGSDAFQFAVLEVCEVTLLDSKEVAWIACLNSVYPAGFNLTSGGREASIALSEVAKEKMRRAKIGSTQSPESRAKTSAGLKGRPKSEEARANMRRAALLRRKPKPEKQLLSAAERSARISKALVESYALRRAERPDSLRKPPWTPERRAQSETYWAARRANPVAQK